MSSIRCARWLATLLCLLAVNAVAIAADRPNFVFIVTDDQGPWALHAAGDPNAVTPNLDRLRASGAMLTRCYSPTPVCSPSRASILTSRYGTELGITDYLPRSDPPLKGLSPEIATWPRALAEAGYATALVGKYHCGELAESHPTRIGYGEFSGFIHGGMVSKDPLMEIDGVERQMSGWTPDLLTDYAIDFLERKQDASFALSLHFWAPHANAGVNEEGDRTWLPLSEADLAPFAGLDPQLPEPDFPKLDQRRTKRMLREYLASVHSVDRNVGRVLATLDRLGLAENTVVIATADHGYNLGHHGIWHKGNGRWLLIDNQGNRANMWDNSLRVPAIVRWPGVIAAGATIDQTCSHLDWFPTILAMAGVEMPQDAVVRGRSVVPLLTGESPPWSEEFFAQYRMREDSGEGADMRSYQTDRWKLVRFQRQRREDEFYDRNNDPEEKTNLIDSSDPDVRQAISELQAKLVSRMSEIGDRVVAE